MVLSSFIPPLQWKGIASHLKPGWGKLQCSEITRAHLKGYLSVYGCREEGGEGVKLIILGKIQNVGSTPPSLLPLLPPLFCSDITYFSVKLGPLGRYMLRMIGDSSLCISHFEPPPPPLPLSYLVCSRAQKIVAGNFSAKPGEGWWRSCFSRFWRGAKMTVSWARSWKSFCGPPGAFTTMIRYYRPCRLSLRSVAFCCIALRCVSLHCVALCCVALLSWPYVTYHRTLPRLQCVPSRIALNIAILFRFVSFCPVIFHFIELRCTASNRWRSYY